MKQFLIYDFGFTIELRILNHGVTETLREK